MEKKLTVNPVTFASAACSLRLMIKTGLNSRFFLRQSDGSLSSNFMLPTEFVKILSLFIRLSDAI